MATFTWTTSAGAGVTGDWTTPSDWGISGPPGSADSAVINAPGSYTVTINNNENETITALALNASGADLSILGTGTLNLLGTLNATLGTVDLTGTIIGGTVDAMGAATFIFDSNATTQLNATLDDVTWQGPMTLSSGGNLDVLGGLTVETAVGGLPGAVDMTAGSAVFSVLDSETLNNMTLAFGSNGGDYLYNLNTAVGTVNLGSGFTLSQSGGTDFLVDDSGGGFSNQGNINVTGGELFGIGSSLTNNGTISASGGGVEDLSSLTLSNSGDVTASSGGDVRLGSIAVNTGSLTMNGSGTIELTQTTSANVTLNGSGDELIIDENTYTGTISGFAPGDTIDLTSLTYGSTPTATLKSGTTLSVVENGTTVHLKLTASNTGETFNLTSDTVNGGTDVTIACFAAGTRIATENGEVPVESLRPGDRVRCVSGDIAPVVWMGHRHIVCERHPSPDLVWPVCVATDAFGIGKPARDLYLSPDHAVYVSGALVAVRLLMNGTTIRQVERPEITYYHVELARHDVLLAEGLPAETYLDTGNRVMFENGGIAVAAHPNFARGQEAREAESCAAFLNDPAQVERLWQSLARRAEELGWRLPKPVPTLNDPDLHLMVGSERIDPVASKGTRYIFALTECRESRFLVSRAARPCDTRPWVDDRRQLGVRVRHLALRNGANLAVVALNDSALEQGWWAVEWEAAMPCRWTTGMAKLPDFRHGLLEVELESTIAYPIEQAATGNGVMAARAA